MNEEINDEIQETVPEPVEPDVLDDYVNETLDSGFNVGNVDQGQEETATETTSEPVSTETPQTIEPQDRGPTRKEAWEQLKGKIEKGEEIKFSDTFGKQSADLRNPLNWGNYPAAMGAGYVDFLTDTVNLVPGVNIPKLPKYESATLQGVRQMSNIIIPTLSLGGLLKKGGAAAHSKVKWALGDKRLMKWFGSAGIDAGVGAVVDEITEFNEFEDNATGSLKKMWPQTYGWIPDDIATLDSDSPDTKRMKNRNEGVGLSFFGDFLLGATKVARALKNTDEALSWVPKNEEATKFVQKNFKKAKKADVDTEISIQSKERAKQFTELGKHNIKESINLDEPIKGVHDVYDHYEVGFRTADPGGIVSAQFDAVRIAKNIDSVDGDVGSIFTDSTLKNTIKAKDGGHMTMKELVKQIKLDIEWHSPKGVKITHKQAVEVGEDIAAALYEFDDTSQMKRLLSNFEGVDVDTGARVLKTEGYAGVTKAISKYFDDYMNMDLARAQGYVSESLADQVVGLSEGMRMMDGTTAVQHAQEQILDRLQYLMTI